MLGLFLIPIDYQAVALPMPAENCIVVESPQSTVDLRMGLRHGDLVLRWPQQLPANMPGQEQPHPDLPVDVEVVADNNGAGGQWSQTFALTVKPGGTLANASTIVYGDETHVNELFAIIKKTNPNAQSPAQVQAGQRIEVTVDASRVHVLRKATDGEGGAQTRQYFNGVTEQIQGQGSAAVDRTVEFPGNAPTESFIWKLGAQEITVPRGHRFVEFRYEQGDSFEDSVNTAYGTLSARAIQDFESQTKWTFDRWPPANGDTAQATISLSRSYQDEELSTLDLSLPDPEADAKYKQLLNARAEAGIIPSKKRADGVIYRVTVIDSSVTARRVSTLLYNMDSRYLEVAEAAGIRVEQSEDEPLPEDFDVSLIGRSFDIDVDFADENYIIEETPSDDPKLTRVLKLLNGTVIEEYKAAAEGEQGMHRVAAYPRGYWRYVYKPDEAFVSLFDFLYFTMNAGQVDSDNQEERNAFVASMLWNWQRDLPREPGDVAEQLTLRDTADGKIMEALVWRRESVSLPELILYQMWSMNPCVALIALVFGASAIFMALVVFIRRAAQRRNLDD